MGSRIAITGATGYLGSLLVRHLRDQGVEVVAFTRQRPPDPELIWREFHLGEPLDPAVFEGIDVLVHAAWLLSGKDTSELWKRNVVGSRSLFQTASAAGVSKTIFISSMSAYFGTKQAYGLMKLAVERTVLDTGGVAIRPGLVYGDSPGGMGGTLKKIAALPLWPRFASAKLFLAHEDDLAPAISHVLDSYDFFAGSVLGFAHPVPLGLTAVLQGLSETHVRRPAVLIPAAAVMAPLKALEAANVTLPFRSDSLLGLVKGPKALPGLEKLADRGISFRPMPA